MFTNVFVFARFHLFFFVSSLLCHFAFEFLDFWQSRARWVGWLRWVRFCYNNPQMSLILGAILRFESVNFVVTKEKASSTLLLPFFWANRIEIFRSFEIPEVSLYKIFKLFFCNKVTKTFKHFCILTTQSFFWE